MCIVSIDIHPQQAFSILCPDELPIKDALSIVPKLNQHADWADYRVLTRDVHSPTAIWPIENGYDSENNRWPQHAVLGTQGCRLLPGLPMPTEYDFMVNIGLDENVHTFGACFYDLAENISTGLIEWLQQRDAKILILGGLATEYCIQVTAAQLCWHGDWTVIVDLAACRAIEADRAEHAIKLMQRAGAIVVAQSETIPKLIYRHQSSITPALQPKYTEQ